VRQPVIVDYVRTPFGRYGGALSTVRTDDLAARVIGATMERTGVDPQEIGEVYMGDTNQAGEDNRNVARMGLLLAGLPVTVPGVTVNRLCASGMEALTCASRAVRCEDGEVMLAGGVESMSRAPLVALKAERGFARGGMELEDSTIGWRFVNPELEKVHGTDSMGETAENVAQRHDVSREDQDAYALESHRRAVAAQESGFFDEELVTVDAPPAGARGARDRGSSPKGDPITVYADEGPRPDSSLERLSTLETIVRDGGTVTAGNSSPINDGAACLTVTGEEHAGELGLEPLARVVATASAGVEPAVMGLGPIPASRRALERAGLTMDDMEVVELNEAFAAQVLACQRELEIDLDRLNVNGGAIALGHPLGASGARLVGTLARELRRRGARHGLATMCVGVGQGQAVVIENPAA
jgi:3-oxoadipyl-CoA thiolase